jgi:Cu(I)/Ag(I) efflux system membrane fusion protein
VELSPGRYAPRVVETGRSSGDRVEIVQGLKAGERVVVSGNFLLDSESRMKGGREAASGTESGDPRCGMLVDQGKARAAGLTSTYGGKSYFFCSPSCKAEFDKSPGRYLGSPAHRAELTQPGEAKPSLLARQRGERPHSSMPGGHHD